MDGGSAAFEESFAALQRAVERLEQGGLPLETALDLFEESMGLAAACHRVLDQAELRLTRLVDEYAEALEADDEA